MKFEEDSSTRSSRSSIQQRNRKKTEWKQNEDQYLKKQIKKLNGKKVVWKYIAKKMQEKYVDDTHEFTAKACRERYNHYLKDGVNNNKFTEKELLKLIELTQTHGNQWSIIAKSMKNRTEQFVKNKFYAVVKKILRIFYNLVFKQRKSTAEINNLKSHIISNLLCRNNDYDSISEEESKIRMIAKELVFKNIKISKQQQLDQQLQTKFLMVLNYLQQQNQQYIKVQKRVNNKCLLNAFYNQISLPLKTGEQVPVIENYLAVENQIPLSQIKRQVFQEEQKSNNSINPIISSQQYKINNSSDDRSNQVGKQKTHFK